MKSVFFSALMAAGLLFGAQVKADTNAAMEMFRVQQTVDFLQQELVTQNMINWKVGEFHKNSVKMSLPFPGEGFKYVRDNVPGRNALWYVNEVSILGQEQVSEILMSRANGETLELIVNGEKQDLDGQEQEMEIIEQYETEVTVEAGTFECFYIKANITQGDQTQEIEAWINPIDVNLDGMLKVVVQSQLGPVTMSLTEFGEQ